MSNRKTHVTTMRLEHWMVSAIEILLETKPHLNRTDYIKQILAEDLRKNGLTPAVVLARKKGTDHE